MVEKVEDVVVLLREAGKLEEANRLLELIGRFNKWITGPKRDLEGKDSRIEGLAEELRSELERRISG